MKKKTLKMLALVTVFALLAMGSGTDETVRKEIGEAQSGMEQTGSKGGTENSGGAKTEDKAPEEPQKHKTSIEEQVCLEQDGIRITATEYVTDSIWGDGIKFLIENDSDKDIGVGCSALIVNDYMIGDLFSETVAAGKKSYETMHLSNSELKAAGIENVGKVEVYFHTFNADTYMTLKNYDCVTIQTSDYDSMDSDANDMGYELYNAGDIKIVGKYVDENSFWGAGILLYIENNSNQNIIVQCDDLSINGFMMTPFFSSTVYQGKKALDDIMLLSSELEQNNITTIEEVELKFKIMTEKFSKIAESGPVSFSVK